MGAVPELLEVGVCQYRIGRHMAASKARSGVGVPGKASQLYPWLLSCSILLCQAKQVLLAPALLQIQRGPLCMPLGYRMPTTGTRGTPHPSLNPLKRRWLILSSTLPAWPVPFRS